MRGNRLRLKHYLIRNLTNADLFGCSRLAVSPPPPPSFLSLPPSLPLCIPAHVLTANDACHVGYVSHVGNSSNIGYSTSKDGIHWSGGRSCFRSRCCR